MYVCMYNTFKKKTGPGGARGPKLGLSEKYMLYSHT